MRNDITPQALGPMGLLIPIGEVKEYLQWRHDEVYAKDLFPPVDYDEVKDKIGDVALMNISADISRRNALSILDWINENIEAKQDAPITPDFLEVVGFKLHRLSETYILDNNDKLNSDHYLSVSFEGGLVQVKEHMGADYKFLPHIRTQSQLAGLITALFGEVDGG